MYTKLLISILLSVLCIITASAGSVFDGHWYSDEFGFAFYIEGDVGITTIDNCPEVGKPGEVNLKISFINGSSFTGNHLFCDGLFKEVNGQLIGENAIKFVGGGYTWIVHRRIIQPKNRR